jgi:serine phosphatase RsbU (regulator of sigma subunit)
LSALRPVQLRYLATARRIGILAVANPSAATAALQDFDEDFLRLQGAQGTVTDQLAAVEQATRSTAARVQDGAERRIVITTALALVGLLIQALLLARAGHRLTAQLARERRIAETLQQGLLPDELPELPGLRLAGRFLPADTGVRVGGDWYDVVPIPSGGCYLVMGDVVGHDLAAAALMGQLRASVRSWTSENLAPAEVFTRLNRQLLAFDRDESATCLLLRLEDGGCGFANAGHLPPLLLDADGNGSYLEGLPCPPLGAVRDFPYQQYETLLPPGATLLLYTDGLVERRGTDLDQRLDALKAAATQVAACCPGDVDPEQLCSHLVRTMCGSEKPVDDVTLLAVTLAGTPAPWLSSSTNRV